MIISHRHKFVFIKTRKTAGSSIEAAIAPHLGPHDMISGSERDGTPRLNWPDDLTGHVGWEVAASLMGGFVPADYRMFACERNSYEKALSDWAYHRWVLGTTGWPAQRWIESKRPSDWRRYSIDDTPVARILRFERIDDDFAVMCGMVGLPEIPLTEYRLKVNQVITRVERYSYANPGVVAAIEDVFRNEIDTFQFKKPWEG